jgi:hypothetical protein
MIKSLPFIWQRLGLFLLATVLAVLFGLIVITANPILIGLAVGLVLGVFLLAMPKQTIWIVLGVGLATPALLDMAGHGLNRMSWAVSMLALLLWVPSIMRILNVNPRQKTHIPLFIWLSMIFVIYALIVTLSQWYSLSEFFGGFKRYFQAYGLMLALALLVITRVEFDRWLKLLLGIALLQLPFALFERFILVPLRGGLAAGGEATDIVAGTMGANLQGGSPNAIMVVFVLTAFAFVFSRWKEKLLETRPMLWLSFLLLLPLVLGETKVVIVMLPLMGLVLLRKDIYNEPSKFLPILMGLFFLTFALAYLYIYYMLDSDFIEAFEGIISYNIGDVGYGNLLLNRTTAMTFWWGLHGWHDPITFLFGHGLGSSYGSGYSAGHMAQLYPKYGINLTSISTILWDLGLVGLGLYFSLLFTAWVQIGQLWKKTTQPLIKADCMALQAGLALTFFLTIYSDSQVNLFVHEIMVAVMLGYATFIHREQHVTTYTDKQKAS